VRAALSLARTRLTQGRGDEARQFWKGFSPCQRGFFGAAAAVVSHSPELTRARDFPLELDLANRVLYWTDRGDPPRGNTVNRAAIDKKAVPQILITHLMEGIGIALDVPGNRMFVTDLAGSVYSADLDGKNERNVLQGQGISPA
jgi:hypothetical protein